MHNGCRRRRCHRRHHRHLRKRTKKQYLPLNGVSRDAVIDRRDIDLPTAAMLMGLLFCTRFHSAILMVDDLPKGRSGKLWQIWGVWFASVLCGEWKMSKETGWSREKCWVEWRKSGASLFEKGKWEADYQFQTVGKNAT